MQLGEILWNSSSCVLTPSLTQFAGMVLTFKDKYGPWAVVTGASSGIGAAFCESLASRALNVVLVARRESRLRALSEKLESTHKVHTRILSYDLAEPGVAERIAEDVADLEIGLLVNNAGSGLHGSFFRSSAQELSQVIAVNVTALVALTSTVGTAIAKRGKGGIIFISSIGARPMPYLATYAASKSFVSTFALSVRYEFAQKGVQVLCVEPGPVESEMQNVATQHSKTNSVDLPVMDAHSAVESSLKALGKSAIHTPGLCNRIVRFITNMLPLSIAIAMCASIVERTFKPEFLLPPF